MSDAPSPRHQEGRNGKRELEESSMVEEIKEGIGGRRRRKTRTRAREEGQGGGSGRRERRGRRIDKRIMMTMTIVEEDEGNACQQWRTPADTWYQLSDNGRCLSE